MKKTLFLFICTAMIFVFPSVAFAAENALADSVFDEVAEYLKKNVAEPKVGSVGGEWAVMGLARSGTDVESGYFENYCRLAENYVKSKNGVLHDKKYTEYSRVIIALTSVGKDPQNVAGYNLLEPLADYNKTVRQGINGSVWALIALDCGGYEIPQNSNAAVCATREMYVNHILENQASDGGWALYGDVADADVTAMVLQALCAYTDDEKVRAATEKAVLRISEIQNENGGFSSGGTENSESDAQVIVALASLGISVDDSRFVKNGNSVLDNMLTYYDCENGGFRHIENGAVNQMATEQCFYALAALKRFYNGQNRLYDMSDAVFVADSKFNGGLPNKNGDVKITDVLYPEKTFEDIAEHSNRKAIEELAARGIVNGKNEKTFDPDATVTRAEFAAIVARGLGLCAKSGGVFFDVGEDDWFFESVNAARFYGIVRGVSETEFCPNGLITREEAAVMIVRAAKLCGNNTDMETFEIRNVLAGFDDYVTAAEWSRGELAFCFKNGILSEDNIEIKPKEAVTRAETAQMFYNMLLISELV